VFSPADTICGSGTPFYRPSDRHRWPQTCSASYSWHGWQLL